MNRTEVFDRVGGLLLLSNTELATTNQVAEFYGVEFKAIEKLMQRNKEELESNGLKMMKYLVIKEFVKLDNMSELRISKRGATVFTKRAILNIGFMLEQSNIAQEVRNRALNIIENSSDEVKVMGINNMTKKS